MKTFRKRTKQNKKRLSKWVLLTLKKSSLKKMDRDTLEGYAKLYKVKQFKKKTDKELIKELGRFFSDQEKKHNNYWECIKEEKKSIGKYPFKSRNNTSKKFKAMSLNEKVKHTQRKIRNLRTKYKKEIDIYNKKTARMYKKCNKLQQI